MLILIFLKIESRYKDKHTLIICNCNYLLIRYIITFRCRMFISPRKRYLYCVNHCVSMENFLNDIFGGQTGDKISHIKRKKNNKTTS